MAGFRQALGEGGASAAAPAGAARCVCWPPFDLQPAGRAGGVAQWWSIGSRHEALASDSSAGVGAVGEGEREKKENYYHLK